MDHEELQRQLARSEEQLSGRLSRMADAAAAAPSRLPRWTRGHLVTHIARNADTVADLVEGARRGEVLTMYGGDVDQRNADIEAGAARGPDELRADLGRSAARFAAALGALTDPDWDREVRRVNGTSLTVAELTAARWLEVEIHHVDLGLDYRAVDWPEDFVAFALPGQLDRLPQRAPGTTPLQLPDSELLAWLVGRGDAGLPELPAWP